MLDPHITPPSSPGNYQQPRHPSHGDASLSLETLRLLYKYDRLPTPHSTVFHSQLHSLGSYLPIELITTQLHPSLDIYLSSWLISDDFGADGEFAFGDISNISQYPPEGQSLWTFAFHRTEFLSNVYLGHGSDNEKNLEGRISATLSIDPEIDSLEGINSHDETDHEINSHEDETDENGDETENEDEYETEDENGDETEVEDECEKMKMRLRKRMEIRLRIGLRARLLASLSTKG